MRSEQQTTDVGEKTNKEAPLARGVWEMSIVSVAGVGPPKLRKRAIECAPLTLKKKRMPRARPLMHTLNPES